MHHWQGALGFGVGLAKGPIFHFLELLNDFAEMNRQDRHFIRFAGMLGTVESVGCAPHSPQPQW